MLSLQCQSSLAYFNIQCDRCHNFVRVEYLGLDQGVPAIEAHCESCQVSQRFKMGNRWAGLPAQPSEEGRGPAARQTREREWVVRGHDRRRGVDRRRGADRRRSAESMAGRL